MIGQGAWIALTLTCPLGAILGRVFAGVARSLARGPAPAPGPRWRDPASAVCAFLPLAAALYAPCLVPALAMTSVGWLLLAIAVCDERTLRIPHAAWVAGISLGLVIAWSVGGWPAVGTRALGIVVIDCGLLLCAGLAGVVRRRAVVGTGDYGVVAFAAAVCGPGATLDVLLLAGIVGLAFLVQRHAAPGRRTVASASGVAAVLAAALFGVPGCVAGATVLALQVVRADPGGRAASAAPLGSCLAAATILLVLSAGVCPGPARSALQHDIVLHLLLP